MSTVTASVISEATLTAKFNFQNIATGQETIFDNCRSAQIVATPGMQFALSIEVVGSNGVKYKISVSGAAQAEYPEDEQTIDNGRDLILVTFTA